MLGVPAGTPMRCADPDTGVNERDLVLLLELRATTNLQCARPRQAASWIKDAASGVVWSVPAFPVRDVSGWAESRVEQMGSKAKVWLEQPGGSQWLYKYARSDGAGRLYGDDWAEVLAYHLAQLVGVPAPLVEFAERDGARGIVCRLMNDPDAEELVHGNELLGDATPNYDPTQLREHPLYTVPAVEAVLRDSLPPASPPELESFDGFDVWAGYLLFDAWIANTDRHHENWGVLVHRRTGAVTLAPSFDHGSSLGFNVMAEQLSRLLADPQQMRGWCGRGRSKHFAGRPRLLDVAVEALSSATPAAAAHWRGVLEAVEPRVWRRTLQRVPAGKMSEGSRTFVDQVLEINRGRLFDASW